MHIISNERALAHWRALCGLPHRRLDLLDARFMQEQPVLAQTIAALIGGEEWSGKTSEDLDRDPQFREFTELLTGGARLAELFRREAGHPLRKLGDAEEEALFLADFEAMKALPKWPGPNEPDIFTTSAQPDLLRGVVFEHPSDKDSVEDEGKAALIYRFLVQALHQACGDPPPDLAGDWDVERILIALSAQGDPLRRQALDAAELFRAELTPLLIQELESAAADPEAASEEDVSVIMHAFFLLAKWREHSAWPDCRKLFSLQGDTPYDLLGDFITEEGSVLLAMIGASVPNQLREMIEAEELDRYCRGACLDALTSLVAWGEMPREEHVAYLRELLTTKLRDVPQNDYAFAVVVSAACDLEAWDLRPEIEAAFDRGVVDDGFITVDFFLQSAAGKYGNQWKDFCKDHQQITDVAAATEWLDSPPRPPDEPTLPFDSEVIPDGDEHLIANSAVPYIAPPKIGRNDPCPCGSGKKYKKCCGK